MSNTNPIKSFEPAKGVSPDKFFDRIRPRHVIALCGAVAVLLLAMGISSVSYKLQKESSDALDNHARVEQNSQLEYYLIVKSDGVDKNGVTSSDTRIANVGTGVVVVTDRIPDGLTFVGFKTTKNGTIGAVSRDGSATSCAGHVVDDTKESRTNQGTWASGNTEYYYHGVHYNPATRMVSFKAENIEAGCELSVGIITKTPTLGDAQRMDFYNTANLRDGTVNQNSNTIHSWMGIEKLDVTSVSTYDVSYSYTGTVPENAPAVPSTQSYTEGTNVGVAVSPEVDGYQFSGWQTSDAELENGSFAMPAAAVSFTGSFTAKPVATKYNVTYEIDGETPFDYVAPKTKQYEAGEIVPLDSLAKNAEIDEYLFNGWTSQDASLSERGFTMPEGNVTIHGSFTKKTYKVTYAFEGSTYPPSYRTLLPAVKEYPAGEIVHLEDEPVSDGYTFTGWYQSETFEMPAEDITIYGEWMRQLGSFSPTISMRILKEKEVYRVGDTVSFEITVRNSLSVPVSNVQLTDELEGASFQRRSNYTVKDDGRVVIPSIQANSYVKIYVDYEVTENIDQTYTNSAQLDGAVAEGYQFDEETDHVASVSFNTEFYEEPEPEPEPDPEPEPEPGNQGTGTEGEKESGKEEGRPERKSVGGIIVNTLDKISDYVLVGFVGIIGIIASVFMMVKTIKNEQLSGVKRAFLKMKGLGRFFNPNTATRGRLIAMATMDLALIALAVGLAINLPQKIADKNADVSTIDLMSSDADYDNGEGGSWKLTKSAKWVGDGEAELTINVSTNRKSSDAKRDIVFAVDVSASMRGNKLNQVKTDMSEVVDDLLNDEENRVAFVSFDSNAYVKYGFTNDKDSALSVINGLAVGSNTNYYDALSKVGDVLNGYTEDANRELYVLILTDGLPTVGSPYEVEEFAALKQLYPYATFGAIQYEMGQGGVLAPIKRISDEQYIADMSSLHNTLFDVVAMPRNYTEFTVTDYVDSRYFSVDETSSLKASAGSALLTEEDGTQKIVWSMEDKLRSGKSVRLTVKLKLKDAYKRAGGTYSTNKRENVVSSIEGGRDENVSSTESPSLRNNYSVIYEANAPSDCTVSGTPGQEERFVYQIAEISDSVPVCEGYNFNGYVVVSDVAKRFNEDYFRMPEGDVRIRATWSKSSIEKKAEGEVYWVKTLYNTIAKKTTGTDEYVKYADYPSKKNGLGVLTFYPTVDDENPIYYYRGSGDNNVIYANYCWKAMRTTGTGGVKLVYNGSPTASGQCKNGAASSYGVTDIGAVAFNPNNNSLAYNGYMYGTVYPETSKKLGGKKTFLSSASLSTDYWYADRASYNEPVEGVWNLVDAYQISSTDDYGSLVGKYTFGNQEDAYTSGTVNYIVGVSGSTYYYIGLSGNTTLDAVNYSMVYGDGFSDNGDGTYAITDTSEIKTIRLTDWFSEYNKVKNKYICVTNDANSCSQPWYAYYSNVTRLNYTTPLQAYKFSNSFSYNNGEYTLDNDTSVNIWNVVDSEEKMKLNNAHYTCFNTSGVCGTVYYVFFLFDYTSFGTNVTSLVYDIDPTLRYVSLTNGKGIGDAISEMQQNTTSSTIKNKLDTWYENNVKDTSNEEYLEDTTFCNNRTITTLAGWNPNGGGVSTGLMKYKVSFSNSEPPTFECDNPNDSFTVNPENGNGALTYPIGLYSYDEVKITHGTCPTCYNSPTYLDGLSNSNSFAWMMTPVGQYMAGSSVSSLSTATYNETVGGNASQLVTKSGAARPVVSIKPGVLISGGSGTTTSPWTLELPE